MEAGEWARQEGQGSRVVVHLDLDCFFVQVERLKDPSLEGKVVAVQQHNDIIAVDYEARRRGLRKHMTPAEALTLCPDLRLVHVRRSAGTSKVTYEDYQKASSEVRRLVRATLDVLMEQAGAKGETVEVEKASIDDFYIDLTPLVALQLDHSNIASQSSQPQCEWPGKVQGVVPHVMSSHDMQLREGARLAALLRQAVHSKLGLKASAGISSNKFLSKLASSSSKPNGQTTILSSSVAQMLSQIPPSKIPQLGVKLGKERRSVLLGGEWREKVRVISDLTEVPFEELAQSFGDKAEWLHKLGQGIDDEPVKDKGPPKSLMSSMSLTSIMNDTQQLKKILHYLADELCRRLEEDEMDWRRKPKSFVFSFRLVNEKESSHTVPMKKINARVRELTTQTTPTLPMHAMAESMCATALHLFNSAVGDRAWKVRWAGMIARDFLTTDEPKSSIAKFFTPSTPSSGTSRCKAASAQTSGKRPAPPFEDGSTDRKIAEQKSSSLKTSPAKRARKTSGQRSSGQEKPSNTILNYLTPKSTVP